MPLQSTNWTHQLQEGKWRGSSGATQNIQKTKINLHFSHTSSDLAAGGVAAGPV